MHKSNTNSEEIFDNNDENIKTIEKRLQIRHFVEINRFYFARKTINQLCLLAIDIYVS